MLCQGAFLLATLMHNWHRPLYAKRGGKRQIKENYPTSQNYVHPFPCCRTGPLRKRQELVECLVIFITWPRKLQVQGHACGLTVSSHDHLHAIQEPKSPSPQDPLPQACWRERGALQKSMHIKLTLAKLACVRLSTYQMLRSLRRMVKQKQKQLCYECQSLCIWQGAVPELLVVDVDDEPIALEAVLLSFHHFVHHFPTFPNVCNPPL